MNFFSKSSALLQAQRRDFEEIFPEVPEDYNPTRAIPIDYTEISNTLNNMWQAITNNTMSLEDSIELYSTYNTYSGVIPEPYLTYFSSLYSKEVFSNYVSFVTQETSGSYTSTVYNMFISDDLIYNGSSFSGSGTLYKYYTSSRFPTYTYAQDSSFVLVPHSGAVFSSLPSPYPDFTVTHLSGRYVLYALFFVFLFFCFSSLFHVKHYFKRR